jgi:acetolactate decarboxylase
MDHRHLAFIALMAALFIAALTFSGGSPPELPDREIIYQVSTIDALMAGAYDGVTSFGELRTRGDLGIGTFDRLDGEAVGIDGMWFQVRSDGSVLPVPDSMTTSLATVTYFDADQVIPVSGPLNLSALEAELENAFSSKGYFYAVRIDGNFSGLKARAVPAQEPPYPPLAEVAKNQSVFFWDEFNGSIVGYWSPEASSGIAVPGWHLHAISTDRGQGGHLIDCDIQDGVVRLDETRRLVLELSGETGQDKSREEKEQELEEIEG